jgi:hypothetical protein
MDNEEDLNKTLEEIKTEVFIDGVRYTLDRLEEVFGSEVRETDVWKEYNSTIKDEDN